MGWWINLLKILGKTGFLIVLCVFMRIKYWIDPSARKRDMGKMQAEGKYEITEDNKKYWVSSDPDNMTNFLWTWKQVSASWHAMWQDLNKVTKSMECRVLHLQESVSPIQNCVYN